MKRKIVLTIYSTIPNKTYQDKLMFMRKMVGDYNTMSQDEYLKTSFIRQFNNSHGCKKLLDDERYNVSPDALLRNGITFLNKKDELVTFIIEEKTLDYGKDARSFVNTIEVAVEFQEFLYRHFSDIKIKISLEKNFELSLKDFTLGHFMDCFAYSEYNETEFSAERMLKKREVDYIINIISQFLPFEPKITQFWCETCYGYDKTKPYHIQVDNAKLLEEYENSLA